MRHRDPVLGAASELVRRGEENEAHERRTKQERVQELAVRLQDLANGYLAMNDEALLSTVTKAPLPFAHGTEKELARCVQICRELGPDAPLLLRLADDWGECWRNTKAAWLSLSSGAEPSGSRYAIPPLGGRPADGSTQALRIWLWLYQLVDRSETIHELVGRSARATPRSLAKPHSE